MEKHIHGGDVYTSSGAALTFQQTVILLVPRRESKEAIIKQFGTYKRLPPGRLHSLKKSHCRI